ncbi:TlpA disulfide reductase family protein [Pedobacter borealis]|uniref:TlpA disulfide reductase family protein n=1 Tax=Pedobacter borealis TaxID=475254 RepID=UPI001428C0FF|nr:TlpA disulfide reductase family protein [Pedobacter borealis]
MKRVLFLFFSLMACTGIVHAQWAEPKPFKITGTIKDNPQISRVEAANNARGGGEPILADVRNGQYTISGKITEPVVMTLTGYGKQDDADFDYQANTYELYLAPGNAVLVSNKALGNVHASGDGAKWDNDYHFLTKQAKLTQKANFQLSIDVQNLFTKIEMYKRGKGATGYGPKEYKSDSIEFAKISHAFNAGILDSTLVHGTLIPYIKKHPESPLSIWALENIGGPRKEIIYDVQFPLFEKLSPGVKALSSAKLFQKKLALNNAIQIGKTAPVFTLLDSLGNSLSLESLRGKYVLVDFWADWCAPCRAEFPYLSKANNQYSSKGFVILGVSVNMNTTPLKWKQAIVAEKSKWLHVYDEKGAVGKQYGIKSIPQNFLLDPKGVIIAVNLRGEELGKKLKELFGE